MYQTTYKKRSSSRKQALLGLLAVVLLLLSGCSFLKVPVKQAPILPPQELLADCPEVVEQIRTNGELVGTILAYRASLSTCTIDKRNLREWVESNQ